MGIQREGLGAYGWDSDDGIHRVDVDYVGLRLSRDVVPSLRYSSRDMYLLRGSTIRNSSDGANRTAASGTNLPACVPDCSLRLWFHEPLGKHIHSTDCVVIVPAFKEYTLP